MRRWQHISIGILFLCLVVYLYLVSTQRARARYDEHAYAGATYSILYDGHQAKILIGVPANIDEDGLRMTLAKAADEHQDYSQRDYMLSSHLWVEAYLVDGDRRSTLAGRLRRYVPPANGVKEYLGYDIFLYLLLAKGDTFNIALHDARQSLGLR